MRLVAYLPGGVEEREFEERTRIQIGSARGCGWRLRGAGVESRHAEVERDGDTLRIRYLGEGDGLEINHETVEGAQLQPLDEIQLGDVTLILDDVDWETAASSEVAPTATPAIGDIEEFPGSALEAVAQVSDWVLGDYGSHRSLESVLTGALTRWSGGAFFLFQEQGDEWVIHFSIASEAAWLGEATELLNGWVGEEGEGGGGGSATSTQRGELGKVPATVCYSLIHALERRYLAAVALPSLELEGLEGHLEWTVRTLGALVILGLVHHVGHFEPILPGKGSGGELVVASGLVIGEAESSRYLMQQLRLLAASEEPILIVGEPGCEMHALAQTLHLSSPRGTEPFITASARGADPTQVESDLFGSELPGRHEPIRRAGRLAEADGGTLVLDGVEDLTPELQSKLVRVLRWGQISPRGSDRLEAVDVRVVAVSHTPLEALAESGRVRPDLAYLLTRAALRVPPLRDRREDLPLLVQWLINRFSHETGKRIVGISTTAMHSLVRYHYPGNLQELEGIVRELVYSCSSGQPIRLEDLPPKLRRAPGLEPRGVEMGGELDLKRMVRDLESHAIKEALRRTDGNRSAASRLLGVSRNGLAMKMERYGIEGEGIRR